MAARNFRLALALMAYFDLEAEQIDISNAFLNATLDMESPVYCTAPEGFGSKETAFRLRKALYGMTKSPKLWYEELLKTLQDLGLLPVGDEPCMCVSEQSKVIVIFFVDDIVVFYFKEHTKEGKAVISGLKAKYELREGPLSWFLGMRVLRDRERRTATILHDFYIEKIGMRFRFTESKGYPTTPLPEGFIPRFEGKTSPEKIKLYQEMIGSILYTAIMLRPDVAHAASLLSRFLTNPSPFHRRLAKRVLQYLYGTRFLGIRYGVTQTIQHLVMASDASFGDDPEIRKSSEGYVMILFGGAINWRAARQTTVTTSTTEAKLHALSKAAKETMAFKRIFRNIRLNLGQPWELYCDNKQTIRLVVDKNSRISTSLRHVDIQNMWLKQEHARENFTVTYLETELMPADGLTKPLSLSKFEHFRALLNLYDAQHEVQGGSQAR